MINIYIVDYYDLFKSNGLSVYVTHLINIFPKGQISLHHIWIKSSTKSKALSKEISSTKTSQLFIPWDINAPSTFDLDCKAADFIASDALAKQNIIFHFNWINHCAFAFLLKQKIKKCVTVLTKHCIPWRDSITENYRVFTSINKQAMGVSSQLHLHFLLHKEQLAYSAVDHIICVTRFAKEAVSKIFQFPDTKISVIHNGFQIGKIVKKQKKSLKKKYGFTVKEKLILYAGAVQERKGIWDLIEIFDEVTKTESNVRLVIAGGGQHSRIFETTNKNWSRITVTGNLDKATLYDFYQMADIGIVPSYVEQCSYTAIEMMCHKLPIIVADVDGLAEIVPDDCGLKVPLVLGKTKASIHRKKLTNSILYFLKNPQISTEYSARAKKHAFRNFNAQEMVLKTIKVYEDLIAATSVKEAPPYYIKGNPLVSILLPCYNAERYLKDCIESVLRQTYTNFELLIINDGSTDGTCSIIETFKDNRIRFINNDTNSGIVYCLNQGIKHAKGKYLARIDADDLMHEERLQKQVLYLEDEHNNEVVMVGSSHFIIDESGKMIGLKQYPLSDTEIKTFMLFQNPFSHPSIMIRLNALKKVKYNNKYKHAEDYHLWFKLSKKYKLANLPEFLTYYRVHKVNTSHENAKEQQQNTLRLISNELSKLGIEYTPNELVLHIAINAGYGTRYFNQPQKVKELQNWIDKILSALKAKYGFINKFFRQSKTFILQNYCGIYS